MFDSLYYDTKYLLFRVDNKYTRDIHVETEILMTPTFIVEISYRLIPTPKGDLKIDKMNPRFIKGVEDLKFIFDILKCDMRSKMFSRKYKCVYDVLKSLQNRSRILIEFYKSLGKKYDIYEILHEGAKVRINYYNRESGALSLKEDDQIEKSYDFKSFKDWLYIMVRKYSSVKVIT